MANPKIEVEIGAVIDGLRKGFGESVKIIETLEKQALDLDKALKAATDLPTIQSLNTQLLQTKAAISQLKTAGLDPLTKATSNYNSVGTDFARIIQDAPFGIIGVGNNITQLAGSFQVLKNQTGSTGAAVKAALASIISPANALVLGISVLTTVFTVLQQKGFFKTEESAKSLADQLEQYRQTLDAVTKASIEGQANAAKEIQSFALLRAQAENTNISFQKRLDAVNELRKQYPDYLKNLTDEQILTGNVGDAYNKLTAGLIATAKARAASDQIAKNSLDVLTLTTQEEERALKIKQLQIDRSQTLAEADRQTARDRQDYLTKASAIQGNINDLEAENLKSKDQRNKIAQSELKLTELINQSVSNGAIFTNQKLSASKQINTEKEKELKLEDEIAKNVEFTNKLQQDALKKVQELAPALLDVSTKFKDINIDFKPVDIVPQIDDSKTTAFLLRLQEFNAQVSQVLEGGAQQTIGDFAFAIGDALASGGNVLKAAGAALLGGLAGILNQLGQLAIATGLTITGIKKALQTLNPAVAIGAGVALIALAGFVSSKAKSLGSAAPGGGGGGGAASVGGAGVGGGSSFVGGAQGGLFQQNRDVSGEFVVRGQDLVYVLGQANNRINKG